MLAVVGRKRLAGHGDAEQGMHQFGSARGGNPVDHCKAFADVHVLALG